MPRLLSDERGYSLVELIAVLTIMTTVLGALTAVFVAGANGELDMNRRFQAQHGARLALDLLRRDVHCAGSAAPTGASNSVTLTLPLHCRTGGGYVTWCTQSVTSTRSTLYRVAGSTCTGGVQRADYLYIPAGSTAFCFTPASTQSRATLRATFTVSIDPVRHPKSAYNLEDSLALRNASLAGTPATPAPC